MNNRQGRRITQINQRIIESFSSIDQINQFAGPNLPSIVAIANIFETFRHILFPGFQYGKKKDEPQIKQCVQSLIQTFSQKLTTQIALCLDNEPEIKAQETALDILQRSCKNG